MTARANRPAHPPGTRRKNLKSSIRLTGRPTYPRVTLAPSSKRSRQPHLAATLLPHESRNHRESKKMQKFTNAVVSFLKDESGPTAVEYAVMLALIIVVCITAITTLGS